MSPLPNYSCKTAMRVTVKTCFLQKKKIGDIQGNRSGIFGYSCVLGYDSLPVADW